MTVFTSVNKLLLSVALCVIIDHPMAQSTSNTTISDMEWWNGTTNIPIGLREMFAGYNAETNELWLIGGKDKDYNKLSSIYIMDMDTYNITLSTSVLQTAMSCQIQAYTQIGSNMYFIDSGWTDKSLHKLDMSTYTTSITAISTFPYSTLDYTVGCLAHYNDKIYMAGVSRTCCRRTVVYSLTADTWSLGAHIGDYRRSHTCHVVDGLLYVIGGADSADTPFSIHTVVMWDVKNDPSADEYQYLPFNELTPGRARHRSIDIGNGRILISGGIVGEFWSTHPTNLVTLFYTLSADDGSGESGYFEDLNLLIQNRVWHGFVQVNDYFMVIGGYGDSYSATYDNWEYTDNVPTAEPTEIVPSSNNQETKEWYQDGPGIYLLIFGTIFVVIVMLFGVICIYRKKNCFKSRGEYAGLLEMK